MPESTAIVRAKSSLLRRRITFWLFLALLLTLASLIQLGHTITTGVAGADIGYSLMSADEHSDQGCPSHGEAISGSHCGSVSGCAVAIASTLVSASPVSAKSAQARASDAAPAGRAPSPLLHPPKLIVQA